VTVAQALDNAPVLIGLGECIDRECQLETRALIAAAVRQAIEDAPAVAESVDVLGVVGIVSWRYEEIGRVLAADVGLSPGETWESPAGGEKPIRLLGELAQRIAHGEIRAAILCGGEAMKTRADAAKDQRALDWGPTDRNAKPITALDFVTPFAARYGLARPTDIYPLYENATRHAWGMPQAEADRESAELWSRYSDTASGNPYAWLPRPHSAAQIGTATADNRLIAFPYRKLMVANPSVNQAAALLVTSRGAALAAGVPEERLIYIGSGAHADEPADFLMRDRFDRSTAQNAVLHETLERNAATTETIDAIEFYSCFPVVPKMARRTLGLAENFEPSIAGGLTFFGGPANNYMTHAITAAARALRNGLRQQALLYGQGEFVTKHAAILLGAGPFPNGAAMVDVQAEADAQADPAPMLSPDYQGDVTVETFTITYGRDGAPTQATLLLRTPGGERTVAIVPGTDRGTIDRLTHGDPIGARGVVVAGDQGLQRFHWAA